MKNILIFLFICFGFALNSQITITCYECKKNTTVDCKGCNIQSNLFTGIVIKEKGKPDIPLYEPYKVSNKSSVFTFEDAFGTKTIVNVTSVLSYNTPKKLYDYLSNCLCKPSTIDTDTDRYSVLIQDSILVTYDINGVEIDRDTIRLFDIDTDTKTFLVQDSILVYYDIQNNEIGRDTIKIPFVDTDIQTYLTQDSILVYYDESNTEIGRDTISIPSIPNITEQGDFRISNDTLYHNNSIDGIEQFVKLPSIDTTTQSYLPILNGLDTIGYENITYLGGVEVDRDTIDYKLWYEKRICLNTATPSFTPADPLMPTYAEVQAWVTANLTIKQQLNGTHVVYFIAGQGGDCDTPDYTWVLNQGSELVTRTQNTILTLPNYTALRNLTKYNHDVVIVQDWTYTGPDGNDYTTIGGIFKWTGNASLENGGTLIKGWERQWDGIHVQPEWWEVGGYNSFGTISLNTPTEIFNDGDRIIMATNLAEGLTINLLPKTYTISKSIQLKDYQKLNGNGAVLKRKQMPALTCTGNNTTSITVSDGSYFRPGMLINIGTQSNAVFGSVILSISGNVLTLNNPAPIGTYSIYMSLTIVSVVRTDESGNINPYSVGNEVTNLTFDGSVAASDFQYWNGGDWTIVGNTYIGSDYPGIWIHKCKFINIPQENIYLGGGIVENNYAENGMGSFIHFNSDNENISNSEINKRYSVIVKDNIIRNFCQINIGHNEGIFTFSNKNPSVRIVNNKIYGSNTGILGYLTGDDPMLLFENNECHNAKKQIIKITSGSGENTLSVSILNNKFYSCGDINSELQLGTTYDLKIIGNEIYNGRIQIYNTTNLIIENNTIAWVSGLYGFSGFDINYGDIFNSDGTQSFIYMRDCFNVSIKNNDIHSDGDSLHDSQYIHGILYYLPTLVDGTTITDDKKLDISNNFISGFRKSISLADYSSMDRVQLKQVAFWTVTNNKIVMAQNLINTGNYAIMTAAGTEVTNNSIWMNNETTVDLTFGIVAHGANTLSDAASIFGSVVTGNRVYGGISTANSASICIGYFGWNYYNNVVEGNITRLAILNNSSGKSYVANNLLLSTITPNYTTPPPTRWKFNYSTIGI